MPKEIAIVTSGHERRQESLGSLSATELLEERLAAMTAELSFIQTRTPMIEVPAAIEEIGNSLGIGVEA